MSARRENESEVDVEGLAPRWHTAALIILMLAVAITGIVEASHGDALSTTNAGTSRITAIYLPMIAVQWGLAIYVCRIGRPRNALARLIGERWTSIRRALTDCALAAIGFLVIEASERLSAQVFAARQAASVVTMLPHALSERAVWVVVAISVGFSEEIVYRGYLQKQLGAFARNTTLGIVLQALLFGIAHAQQGAFAAARFGLYGLGFGGVARWRRSLLAGIVCHILIDLTSGLVHP